MSPHEFIKTGKTGQGTRTRQKNKAPFLKREKAADFISSKISGIYLFFMSKLDSWAIVLGWL
jgi:hypothetical protein